MNTAKPSAIFLAIVLIIGTIGTISPSFMLGAQAEPYYDGMDDRYDSYEPTYLPNNEDYDNEYTPDEDGKSYYNEEPYSYGDSYSDDMYSEYPTKDKKFECEEGPFTGFFVSDPIFCDVELPQGPAGPAGPNQIGSTNLYLVEGNIVERSPTSLFDVSFATCETGDVVLEGGYLSGAFFASHSTTDEGPLLAPRPFPLFYEGPEASAYGVNIQGPSGTTFQAYAYCFDNPPLRSPLASPSASVSPVQQPEDSPLISQGIGYSSTISQVKGDTSELTALEKTTKLKQQWLGLLP